MSTQYQPGEIVDIAIKGARATDAADHGGKVAFDVPGDRIWLPRVCFTATRRAPAEWPPQTGDVWRDRNGDAWFARSGEGAVAMYPAVAWLNIVAADELLDMTALTLVYREGWTPAAPEVDEPDERASVVAGLRELADLIEANSDMPLPRYSLHMSGALGSVDEVTTAARALGVEVIRSIDAAGLTHTRTVREFGIFELELSRVEREAPAVSSSGLSS